MCSSDLSCASFSPAGLEPELELAGLPPLETPGSAALLQAASSTANTVATVTHRLRQAFRIMFRMLNLQVPGWAGTLILCLSGLKLILTMLTRGQS